MAEKSKIIAVKVSPVLHALVMAKAADESVSVSGMLRQRLEAWVAPPADATGGAAPPLGMYAHDDKMVPAAPQPAKPPRIIPTLSATDESPAICPHPKAALVHLSGGLARCGACGVNRKADGSWPA